jgi:hypothetical protein
MNNSWLQSASATWIHGCDTWSATAPCEFKIPAYTSWIHGCRSGRSAATRHPKRYSSGRCTLLVGCTTPGRSSKTARRMRHTRAPTHLRGGPTSSRSRGAGTGGGDGWFARRWRIAPAEAWRRRVENVSVHSQITLWPVDIAAGATIFGGLKRF